MNPRNAEVAYLKRLIKDFPADVAPDEASRALNMITARYQVIEQSYRSLSLTDLEKKQSETNFIAAFKFRIFVLHEYLFDGILANAGEFRKVSDPKGGHIGFGGIKHQRQQPQFKAQLLPI